MGKPEMDMRIYLSTKRWKHGYWLIGKGKPNEAIPKAKKIIKKLGESDEQNDRG